MLLLRTIVVVVVLGLSMWLLGLGDEAPGSALWLQSTIIATTFLSSIALGVALARGMEAPQVGRLMLSSDLLVTSALVYLTGGAQSPYMVLYALTIVSAGAILYRRGALVVTVAAIAMAVVTSVLAWQHVVDLPMSENVRPWEVAGIEMARALGINSATMVGVGMLALIFGDQLQRGAETLATTRRAAADVLSLHQDIVRSLSSGLITIAPDGTILTANEAARDILKRSDDVIGEHLDKVMPKLLDLSEGGSMRRADLTIPASGEGDGELVVGATVSPLRDAHDVQIGRIVNFQDLTELRRLEQHMRRSERLATVGQLAAGIAHEIRNPLAAISGSVELLRSTPQASEDDRALMAIVHREILRLNTMIGDLLDFAAPKPLQPVDLDLAVLVDETVQVARGDAAFAKVELGSNVERPLRVTGDPSKLRQVLWNLVRNAAQSGGTMVHVVARRAANGGAEIEVSDDGAGIPPEQLARVFDPFFTTKAKGTGLGLATSHAVVAEHGGRIDAESQVGKGTSMVVRLPPAATVE